MSGLEVHFEPFLQLAGVADDEALIAWGGFYFRCGAPPMATGASSTTLRQEVVADFHRLQLRLLARPGLRATGWPQE